ncbi:MAG: hypothetical protein EXS31_12470 [Pedosphaera sp.]|nr:hypothetical protein [Pedosphaera sp.]
MPEKAAPSKKLTDKNTKQEMLEAYQSLAKQLESKRQAELNPARQIDEKRSEEALKTAAAIVPDGIDREIGSLKAEISSLLGEVSEKLGAEAARFKSLQKAVETKERELQEIYGIEKAASALAALIEAQNQKREEFETEMNQQREELKVEIDQTRADWQKERQAHDAEVRERDTSEKKARDREKEQFDYAFKREQQSLRDKLNDEKSTIEKELRAKKDAADKDFAEREKGLAEREAELASLRAKAAAYPKELETAVDKAVKETADRLKTDSKNREEMLKKESEGERNVLTTRIESLEKAVKDLTEQNARSNKQLESAYQKVQEIAEKTIESAGQSRSLADLQKLLVEQGRKSGGDK